MRPYLLAAVLMLSSAAVAAPNKVPIGKLLDQMVRRSTLIEPGSKPFYLKATITDRKDDKSQFNGTVEEYWVSPTKWRREVKLRDFAQTRVVNGDQIYEENKGDYFPVNDEMLADEIVDPLPTAAVDLMNKLNMTATEPGGAEGQCMAEQYFNDADGREIRVLLAYNCKTGLLIYLESPSCCYGVMTDYRKFHDKMVAYATKDDPVDIRVDTLRDLNTPDESLFAIPQPSPPEQRLITVQATESQLMKTILKKTEIAWPTTVTKKPGGQTVDVHVVIGRDGKVKESEAYFDGDKAIKDAALAAVSTWTFHPWTIGDVPAQVRAKFVIPFSPQLQAAAVAVPGVGPLFERMRTASGLRLEGQPAFHLSATFQSDDGSAKGSYEETWVSPNKWRREAVLNGASVIEVRTEEGFYRTYPGDYSPRVADDVLDAISFNFPGANGADIHEPDWSTGDWKFGNLPMLRVSAGYINPGGRPDPMTLVYYVDEKTALLRGRFHYSVLTIFNDFQPFAEKKIARKLTLLGGDVKKLEITINTLEKSTGVDESLFHPSGMKPLYTEADEARGFTPPRIIQKEPISVPGWHGTASCDVIVDEHGHARDVEVKGLTEDSVIQGLRQAILKWEFAPATVNGRPSLGQITVQLQ